LMSKGLLLQVYYLCLGIYMNYGGNIHVELEEEKRPKQFRIKKRDKGSINTIVGTSFGKLSMAKLGFTAHCRDSHLQQTR
jgi:hypothetical protein